MKMKKSILTTSIQIILLLGVNATAFANPTNTTVGGVEQDASVTGEANEGSATAVEGSTSSVDNSDNSATDSNNTDTVGNNNNTSTVTTHPH